MTYATMKMLAIISAVMLVSPARADYSETLDGDSFYARAKVISVTPVYETVTVSTPREVCRNVPAGYKQERHYGDYTSATPMIAGGILGAAVGNQFGRGTGKTVTTIAGGVLGGSIARDLQHRHKVSSGYHHDRRVLTRCESIEDFHTEERLDGYRVKYRYNGRIFSTRTETPPGKKIGIRVSVAPEI